MRVGHAQHLRLVYALDLMPGMRQRGGEVAVVGENQQPFGIEVEPSDGIHVLADAFQQIENRGPVFGIRSGRHVTARLVEKKIAVLLRALDTALIDANVVDVGVGFRAELGDGGAVDRDASLLR